MVMKNFIIPLLYTTLRCVHVDKITTKVDLIAHKLRDTKTNANIDWFWRKKTVRKLHYVNSFLELLWRRGGR